MSPFLQLDTDETMSRIREKLLLVDSEDRGRDLKDVQDLLKRLETVTEYMAGLDKRIAEHKSVSKVVIILVSTRIYCVNPVLPDRIRP